MRILQVHNFYQQPGGEDQVFAAESELLLRNGHTVEQYTAHNDELKGASALNMARNTIWSARSYRGVTETIARFCPDVMHCHNIFPVISPAVYYAAHEARVPVVQTVHNYRLICPAATLTRQGKICEDCVGKVFPYPAIMHACYRHNRPASAAVAAMLAVHRTRRTWHEHVNLYIALTEFVRSKLVAGGLPPERILVKPNFLPRDPGEGAGEGGYALFVGRLVPEKGLGTLLSAWELVSNLPLLVAGDGPMRAQVAERANRLSNVRLLGFETHEQVIQQMKRATLLVVPSEWYEGFPMTIVEAMACGTPVIASDLGSLREIVEENVVGPRFEPGNAQQLADLVQKLAASDTRVLRARVRHRFEQFYSAEANYPQLIKAYERAVTEGRR